MAVLIKTIDDRHIEVNDKVLLRDSDGVWIAAEALTPSEERAFKMHLNQ